MSSISVLHEGNTAPPISDAISGDESYHYAYKSDSLLEYRMRGFPRLVGLETQTPKLESSRSQPRDH